MKVTSTKSIRFNKLNWGISAGEVKDLPEEEDARARILSEVDISVIDDKIINKNK